MISSLEEIRRQAKLELGEDETTIEKSLLDLRSYLQEDENLSFPDDAEFLLMFLRARKYDSERAGETLKKFFKLKSNCTDILHLFKPSIYSEFFQCGTVYMGKYRDAKGRHLMMLSNAEWNPDRYNIDEALSGVFMILDEALTSIDTQLNGIVCILDSGGLNLKHVKAISLRGLRNLASVLQDSYPVRFKEFHIVNQSSVFTTVFKMIKPFLKKKMRERICLHGRNHAELHKHVDINLLPKKYGGPHEDDELVDQDILRNLSEKDDYYKHLAKYGFK